MRAFKIRTEPTILTTLKEPPKKVSKRKINWQRISFLILAFGVLFYVGLRTYKALAVIKANGQIELHKQMVNFSNDIYLEEIYISEGQTIKKGDTLFKYSVPVENVLTTSEINIDKPIEWIQREKLNTQKTIEFKTYQLKEIRHQINTRKEMQETKKSLILLGSYNDRNEYEELTLNLNRLMAEESTLMDEIGYLRSLLYRLNHQNDQYQRIETRKKEILEEKYYYVAKLNGIVGQINYNENEICYKKDEFLTIHRTDQMSVKAFFKPGDMKNLREGDVVNIGFPDRKTVQGVISGFHVSTYALPDEFQKKYEPTERNIVAEVKIIDHEKQPSMNYYKMNVLITKNRFNFNVL